MSDHLANIDLFSLCEFLYKKHDVAGLLAEILADPKVDQTADQSALHSIAPR